MPAGKHLVHLACLIIVIAGFYGGHTYSLSRTAIPAKVASLAVGTSCAVGILSQPKPRGMVRAVEYSQSQAWTKGVLGAIENTYRDQLMARHQLERIVSQ